MGVRNPRVTSPRQGRVRGGGGGEGNSYLGIIFTRSNENPTVCPVSPGFPDKRQIINMSPLGGLEPALLSLDISECGSRLSSVQPIQLGH